MLCTIWMCTITRFQWIFKNNVLVQQKCKSGRRLVFLLVAEAVKRTVEIENR